MKLVIRSVSDLAEVDREQWDALDHGPSPFLEYGFLRALELTGSTGGKSGWYPHYLLAEVIADEDEDEDDDSGADDTGDGGDAPKGDRQEPRSMAWSGERYRFFEIESSFPAREDQAHRAYAQSYDFTAFLATRGKHSADYDDGDRFPFREMLAYVAAGDDVHVAAKRAFGAGFGELETEWWEQLRSRYIYAPAGLVGLFVWFIGAVLLVLGWLRRKRQGRRKMQEWAEQDAERDRLARVIALYERDSDDRPRYLN